MSEQADSPKDLMTELQVAVTEATGIDLPEPVKLRRVSGRNVATAALLILAAVIAGRSVMLSSFWTISAETLSSA